MKNTVLFILEREFAMSKRHLLFITLLTTVHILNLDITGGDTAIEIAVLQVHHFGLVCSFSGYVYARTKQHARSQNL